jgi:hypothetical protein
MSSTPHDPNAAPDVVDLGDRTILPAQREPSGGGRRRGLAIGGGLLAVALVGGGVTYGVAALRSDGAAPETVIPASAFAVVKVDLDPSAGQKVDALRFARKFPDAKDKLGGSDDPRKALFDALRGEDEVKGDWAKDVEPWLGQRAAVAVLPGATPEADPAPIVVLAVTDADAARSGLRTVSGGEAECVVSDDFAVCAKDEATASKAVADAGRASIAQDETYDGDVQALGGEGIALGWVDVAKARSAVPALESALSSAAGGAMLGSSLNSDQLKGRYVTALRFDGPNLELTGRVDGAELPATTGTSGVGDLPADTVAAFGTGSMSTIIDAAWKQLRTVSTQMGGGSDFDTQVAEIEGQLGLKIPGDIKDAMGDRASIAFGGLEAGAPKVALRVSGKPESVAKLVGVVNQNAGGAVVLAQAAAGTDTVVASSQPYADAVAKGSGLGSDPAFTAAVPDAKDAEQVGYLNVARLMGIIEEAGAASDTLDDTTKRNLEPLAAFGMTTGRDGSVGTFTLRLTTK